MPIKNWIVYQLIYKKSICKLFDIGRLFSFHFSVINYCSTRWIILKAHAKHCLCNDFPRWPKYVIFDACCKFQKNSEIFYSIIEIFFSIIVRYNLKMTNRASKDILVFIFIKNVKIRFSLLTLLLQVDSICRNILNTSSLTPVNLFKLFVDIILS